MKKKFLYFLLIFSYFSFLNSETIESFYAIKYEKALGKYEIFVHFYGEFVTKKIEIDLYNNFSWFSDKSVKISKCENEPFFKNSKKITNSYFSTKTYDSNECSSAIEFLQINDSVEDFHFFISKDDKYNAGASFHITFARSFDDKNFSLVHKLYDNNVIDELQFGFFNSEIKEEPNQGILYIGKIPLNLTEGRNFGSCEVVEEGSFWGCRLKYLQVMNSKLFYLGKDGLAIFNTNLQYILLPEKIFKFLEQALFATQLKTQACVHFLVTNFLQIRCEKKALNLQEEIRFGFETDIFAFSLGELFICYVNHCESLFGIDKSRENEAVIFGTVFLSKYDSIFNYDKRRITFFVNDASRIINIEAEERKIIHNRKKYIFVILGTLLICGLILSWCSSKDKRFENNIYF